ncbi:MAG: GYD domain protein [Acidobacteria bacterium 13_1_40CM_2_68_5]|nr:MAG: GYD domain protein [Acidobacteria bacterium 13_1_40CM_2_68_5]
MPKYLIQASYTAEGVRGLMKDGGSQRRAAAEAALKGVGGRLEAFYFAFGETDVFAVADVPDNASAAAVSLAVSASGAVQVKTVVLMTPEEMDQAAKKMINYRPPGH